MPKMKKVERMTPIMRTIHWGNAICMVVAVITGLYIGHPYYQTFIADPAVDKYVMAWNRWGHFIAAIIFDVTAILIGYLYLFSRFEKPYKKILPTKKNFIEFCEVFFNLMTFNRRKKFSSEHSDSYNIMFFYSFSLTISIYVIYWTSIICSWISFRREFNWSLVALDVTLCNRLDTLCIWWKYGS